MPSVFRATTQADEAELIALLARAFSTSPDREFLRSDVMRWKYWVPRDDFPEPRSYVIERDGAIVAHVGLWPVSGAMGRGVHMMDWASDTTAPGSGLALVQRLTGMFDFIYAIGGTEMTRKVLPAFGFKHVGEYWTAARPLRAFKQMLTHQARDWKLPARYARNLVWALSPIPAPTRGFEIRPADLSRDDFEPATTDRFARSAGFFRFLVKCPHACVRAYDIHADGHLEGRFAISYLQQQGRVLGMWLASPSAGSWAAANALAQQAARQSELAFEIASGGATGESAQRATAAGLRMQKSEPVFLLRKRGDFPQVPFDFQPADSYDAGFFSEGSIEYLT